MSQTESTAVTDDLTERHDRWHIRVRELTKRFGDNLVLDELGVDFERGKVNVVIGASGAGKSVLDDPVGDGASDDEETAVLEIGAGV